MRSVYEKTIKESNFELFYLLSLIIITHVSVHGRWFHKLCLLSRLCVIFIVMRLRTQLLLCKLAERTYNPVIFEIGFQIVPHLKACAVAREFSSIRIQTFSVTYIRVDYNELIMLVLRKIHINKYFKFYYLLIIQT